MEMQRATKKNGQIRTEIERIFKYIQSSNSELSWFQGKVSDDILSNYIADWITKNSHIEIYYRSKILKECIMILRVLLQSMNLRRIIVKIQTS